MEIDLADIPSSFRAISALRYSRHSVCDRLTPSIFQYDYLGLSTLVADVQRLVAEVECPVPGGTALALDLGSGNSPYRQLLELRGFAVKTMDVDPKTSPDLIGSVEEIRLSDESIDLVICTQVLEHSLDPATGLQEIFRILRPGGYLIASAPHIWFYHPHPSDNWRFTQEGLTRIVATAGLVPRKLLSQGGSVLSYFQIVNFLLFGLLGKRGGPVYAISNVIGKIGDRCFRNSLFCLNFAILAQKP
jgi:SAM-dependent methyltransferase